MRILVILQGREDGPCPSSICMEEEEESLERIVLSPLRNRGEEVHLGVYGREKGDKNPFLSVFSPSFSSYSGKDGRKGQNWKLVGEILRESFETYDAFVVSRKGLLWKEEPSVDWHFLNMPFLERKDMLSDSFLAFPSKYLDSLEKILLSDDFSRKRGRISQSAFLSLLMKEHVPSRFLVPGSYCSFLPSSSSPLFSTPPFSC